MKHMYQSLNLEREEWEAKRRIAKLKLELQSDPSYTEINPKPEPLEFVKMPEIPKEVFDFLLWLNEEIKNG